MAFLERIEHPDGVVTYRSPLLHDRGIVHAFTTRIGGISRPPFDKLNLVSATVASFADDPRAVAENFRRLRAALGLEQAVRVQVKQVHGCGVHTATAAPVKPEEAPEGDAIVSDDQGAMLTIRVADCVPLLISSDDGRVVAAVHAGWRGVVARVVQQTIAKMVERYGVEAGHLVAAIGPCIGVEHFKVGEEVAAAFEQVGLAGAIDRSRMKPHIDLPAAVHAQLRFCGLSVDRIDTTDRCTFTHADEFFSHRRDNGVTGRMAAVITPRS